MSADVPLPRCVHPQPSSCADRSGHACKLSGRSTHRSTDPPPPAVPRAGTPFHPSVWCVQGWTAWAPPECLTFGETGGRASLAPVRIPCRVTPPRRHPSTPGGCRHCRVRQSNATDAEREPCSRDSRAHRRGHVGGHRAGPFPSTVLLTADDCEPPPP